MRLVISTEYHFIGASPDGLVTCCCGDGICEHNYTCTQNIHMNTYL